MIIVLKKDEAKEKIEVVKKAFDGKKQVFVHENRVAVQGAKADEIPSEVLNAAEDVITNVQAAHSPDGQSCKGGRRNGSSRRRIQAENITLLIPGPW